MLAQDNASAPRQQTSCKSRQTERALALSQERQTWLPPWRQAHLQARQRCSPLYSKTCQVSSRALTWRTCHLESEVNSRRRCRQPRASSISSPQPTEPSRASRHPPYTVHPNSVVVAFLCAKPATRSRSLVNSHSRAETPVCKRRDGIKAKKTESSRFDEYRASPSVFTVTEWNPLEQWNTALLTSAGIEGISLHSHVSCVFGATFPGGCSC